MPVGYSWIAGVVICWVIVAAIAYGAYLLGKMFVEGAKLAMIRQEAGECEKWADEAKVYPGYFLLQWQKDQCDARGVAIDAPVISTHN